MGKYTRKKGLRHYLAMLYTYCCGVEQSESTLCEHTICTWNKDPSKLKCLDCGEEIRRA